MEEYKDCWCALTILNKMIAHLVLNGKMTYNDYILHFRDDVKNMEKKIEEN